MKKTTKALAIASGAVVLVAGSVLGTLAFLTDSEQAVNTFTVGNVQIELLEKDIDGSDSDGDGDGYDLKNEYHLYPGATYTKDPTITVEEGSENAYVRMILTVYNASGVEALGGYTEFIDGISTDWTAYGGPVENTDNSVSYEFRYKSTVNGESGTLSPLFTKLTVPTDIDGDELKDLVDNGFKMVIDGHAIQAEGFETEESAWTAFEEQYAE